MLNWAYIAFRYRLAFLLPHAILIIKWSYLTRVLA